MNSRNLMLLIAFGITMPQSLLAAESSCHDYPGHKEVLNEGKGQIYGGSHRTNLELGSFSSFSGRKYVPSNVEECIETLDTAKRNGVDKRWVVSNIEEYADYFFRKNMYKECQEFLVRVLDDLDPVERIEYYEVLAACYVLKDQKRNLKEKSNYLDELTALVDRKVLISETAKNSFSKVCEYVQKASVAQELSTSNIAPERTLRLGLLNIILGKKEEAVKFNDKLVANFRRNIISALPEELDKQGHLNWDYILKKNPFNFYSEKYSISLFDRKDLMLSGAVSLVREVGTAEDTSAIAIRWLRDLYQIPLESNKQSLLISALPENFRSDFTRENFILNCTDFATVFDALKKRGWNAEAVQFKNTFFVEGFASIKKPGTEQITRYYFDKHDTQSALSVYREALIKIDELNNKNTTELELAYARIVPLYNDLSKNKISKSDSVSVETYSIYDSVKHNYDVHKCLELAEELTTTGWKLVDQGDPKAAIKLYKSAVDIREKNLPSSNTILAITYMDAGRTAVMCDEFTYAEDCFQKALKIFSLNPIANADEYKITVESYGSLLNKINRYDEAQKMYARLKEIK